MSAPRRLPAPGYPGADRPRLALLTLLLQLSCASRGLPPRAPGAAAPFQWEDVEWVEAQGILPFSVDGLVLAADAADQLPALRTLSGEESAELILGRSTGGWEGERCVPLAVAAEGLGHCRALPLETGPVSPVWLYTPGSDRAVLPIFGGSDTELTLVCHEGLSKGADSEHGYQVVVTEGGAARWASLEDCPNTPAIRLSRAKSGAAWVRWARVDADIPLPRVRALKEEPFSEALLYKEERRWRAYEGQDALGVPHLGFHDEVSGARVVLPESGHTAPYYFDLDGSGVFELVQRPAGDETWVAEYDGDEDGVADSCWEDWKLAMAPGRIPSFHTFPSVIALAGEGGCGP